MGKTCRDMDCIVEIFGHCNGDYCSQEREALMGIARRRAEPLGHSLSSFEKVKDRAVWQARCKRCGLRAAITLSGSVGDPNVYGEALNETCTDAADPRS